MNIPIHLVTYELFTHLSTWRKKESKYATNKSWQISSWDNKIVCRLSWNMDTQLMSLTKAALSAQEATYLVLEEFYRLNLLS